MMYWTIYRNGYDVNFITAQYLLFFLQELIASLFRITDVIPANLYFILS